MERAKQVIPGGVNSPVRAFKSVDGDPLFIVRAEGAHIFDADGNSYIDYVGSWGPMILGHASPLVAAAVTEALAQGTSFGAPTEREIELAELIYRIVPSMEMVRMVNSGTEATMSAIRLARAYTGREYILKFDGCYHGHSDSLLVKAGSGVATLGIAGSPGVPQAIAALTLSIEYNDLTLAETTIKQLGPDKLAAIIVEPVIGNAGLIPPLPGYLAGLRALCDRHGILLIFDEVMTGFRVALGGAQQLYGVTPDLTTLGKVIGGGLPVGAFGGRREIMELLAPLGPVYQAGTLSGNPLAMAAGKAALNALCQLNPFAKLTEMGARFAEGLVSKAQAAGVPVVATNVGSMVGFFFSASPVRNFSQAKLCDVTRFKSFFHAMLAEGIYLAPSAFEAGFIGILHDEAVIDQTLMSAERAFQRIR